MAGGSYASTPDGRTIRRFKILSLRAGPGTTRDTLLS